MGLQRVGHDWATEQQHNKYTSVYLDEPRTICASNFHLIPSFSIMTISVSSVQFSCSVVSDFLRPHGLQHARLPCPSPTPGAYSNSCPLSRWCHPTISSSVVPFSSHLQSFPASGSFQMSQFLASGGQSIGVSASASVLPMNIQDWFPLGWTGWISLLQGTLKSFLQHHSSKASVPWQFRDVYFTHEENMIWKANQPSQDNTLLAVCTKTKVNPTSGVSFYYKHRLIVDSEKMIRDTEITVQDQMYLGGIWICWIDWS